VPNSPAVVIIGAGISGLACAHFLRKRGVTVRVLEASDRPGGLIHSVEQNGFHFELGPQSFLSSDPLPQLIHDLGIEDEVLTADPRAPRYILRGGKLVQAPMSPFSMIGTPLFGARTKWRLATEILRRAHPPKDEESVASFIRRKFGDDLLDSLVGPMVSGIFAGDPERLSLRSAFPEVECLEREHGSVLRGMLKSRLNKKGKSAPRRSLCSFRDGMETLPRALARSLGPALSYNAPAGSLRRAKSDDHAAFEIQFTAGAAAESVSTRAVVLATTCDVAARLLGDLDASFVNVLAAIEYAPVAIVSAGYARTAIATPTEGFGFLVPRTEGLRMLGTVWNSSIFPGRAPEGHVAMATFAGGATDPEICDWPDSKIADHICGELAGVMQINALPVEVRVQRYARALPQYNLGHAASLGRLAMLIASQPGLFVAGNFWAGPSIGACVQWARCTTLDVSDYLAGIGELTSAPMPSAGQD
jgi:protoporphyrinogen/coproporphyrinogen III oxidase